MLILFARFVPFGAVGTMRMWRSKVVQVVPRIPVLAEVDAMPTTARLEEEDSTSGEHAALSIKPADVTGPAEQDPPGTVP
jgi:hypothetical protein